MVTEVVDAGKLVIDVVKAENAVLELVSFIQFFSLVAAASQDRVDEEDRDAAQHENRVLQEVDNQVGIEVGRACVVHNEAPNFNVFVPLLLLVDDSVDGVADYGCLNDPLAQGPLRKAAVTAESVQTESADHVVQAVVEAETKRDALHLGEEAQVCQQIVEEDVEEGEYD